MQLKSETVGFVRGGMLFLEPPAHWRQWQRDVWSCCPARLERRIWVCANVNCSGAFQHDGTPRFCPYCRGEQLARRA